MSEGSPAVIYPFCNTILLVDLDATVSHNLRARDAPGIRRAHMRAARGASPPARGTPGVRGVRPAFAVSNDHKQTLETCARFTGRAMRRPAGWPGPRGGGGGTSTDA